MTAPIVPAPDTKTDQESTAKKAKAKAGRAKIRKLLRLAVNYAVPVVLIAYALTVLVYVGKFGFSLSTSKSDWGQFGDYLGGVVNPTVSLVTVILLYMTYTTQRSELRAARKAYRRQADELQEANRIATEENVRLRAIAEIDQEPDFTLFSRATTVVGNGAAHIVIMNKGQPAIEPRAVVNDENVAARTTLTFSNQHKFAGADRLEVDISPPMPAADWTLTIWYRNKSGTLRFHRLRFPAGSMTPELERAATVVRPAPAESN